MADAVGLVFIHKDDLVSFGDGLCATNVMQVHATVGEHHVRGDSALLVGLMPARTSTHHIPDRYRLAQHQGSCVDVIHLEVSHSVTSLSAELRYIATGAGRLCRSTRRDLAVPIGDNVHNQPLHCPASQNQRCPVCACSSLQRRSRHTQRPPRQARRDHRRGYELFGGGFGLGAASPRRLSQARVDAWCNGPETSAETVQPALRKCRAI